jgi:hypothetical protein
MSNGLVITPPALAAASCGCYAAAKRRKGTPFVDIRSEEGIFGMTLLQKALLEEEEQQAAGECAECWDEEGWAQDCNLWLPQ